MDTLQDRVVELVKIGNSLKGTRVTGKDRKTVKNSLKGIFKSAKQEQKI
jgi:hypothetical protein